MGLTEVECAEQFLGNRQGGDFGMSRGAVGGYDAVDTDDDEFTGVTLEDSGSEWAACAVFKVQAREANDVSHAFFQGRSVAGETLVFLNRLIWQRDCKIHGCNPLDITMRVRV